MNQSEPVVRLVPDTSGRTGASSPTEAAGDPLLGSVLDSRYLIERVVGSGGFGVVYRAVHLRFDSPVAIKVLRISKRLSEDERRRFIDLFLAEGKLLFTLGAVHPAIVRVFEAGTLQAADGLLAPYLVMEWLDGVSLDQEIRNRAELGSPRLDLAQVIDLLGFCAEGLARAHDMRIAHHDIKPGNIFIVQREKRLATKLLDFGLAKASHDTVTTTSGLAADGAPADCAFTPAYGAPEQWLRRLGATGTWTDVYAFALVCVELLTGRRALQGRVAPELMAACLDETSRPTPRALGLSVPDDVEAVFQRALNVDPRQRYRDAGCFWEALCQSALSGSTAGTGHDHAAATLSDALDTNGAALASAPTDPQGVDDRLGQDMGRATSATRAPDRSHAFRRNTYVVLAMGVMLSLMPSTSARRVPEPSVRRTTVADHPPLTVLPTPVPVVETVMQSSLSSATTSSSATTASPGTTGGHRPRRRPIARVLPDQPTTDSSTADQGEAGATELERLLNRGSLSRRK